MDPMLVSSNTVVQSSDCMARSSHARTNSTTTTNDSVNTYKWDTMTGERSELHEP